MCMPRNTAQVFPAFAWSVQNGISSLFLMVCGGLTLVGQPAERRCDICFVVLVVRLWDLLHVEWSLVWLSGGCPSRNCRMACKSAPCEGQNTCSIL